MVVIINDDRVTDVEAYLPVAKAFAADAVANDEGCISMEVLVDPKTPGRVLYLSHFESAFPETRAGGDVPEMAAGTWKVFYKRGGSHI